MGSRKSGEKSRSLEQRRLVMPCNDGEATRRPARAEEQKLDERNGGRGARGRFRNRGRRSENSAAGGGGGGGERKGKKTIAILYLPTNVEKERLPGSTERESNEIKDVLATVPCIYSLLPCARSFESMSAIKVSAKTKLPCRYYRATVINPRTRNAPGVFDWAVSGE